MEWYEIIIIVVAIILVIAPIITYFVKKKKGTLKCECGHYRSECVGDCSSCSKKVDNQETTSTLTYIVTIDGMKCGMCESHINDIIRKNFDIVKVKSSRKNNNTTIVSDHLLNLIKLKESVSSAGYEVKSIRVR